MKTSALTSLLAPALALALASDVRAQEGGGDAPPNFADDVEMLLSDYCTSCHRGSRAKNGLQLTSVASILKGGSSGPAVVPGDPEGSLLFKVVEHTLGPFMPPEEDKLPAEDRALLREWIASGARVDANDTGQPAAKPEAVVLPVATPGAVVLPEPGLSIEPYTWTDRGGAVTALAASPGAPLVAVGGLGQISLYALPGGERAAGELLAVLPFPEGRPERLSFASSGGVLLAAGGRPGDRGIAAGYDVATGERLFTVGDEPETVLDAAVTGDLAVVVLGGPDRVLRAYDPSTGELRWESKAHTDWVTAIAVSPGGALVASGDRAGGVVVLETFTGREFHRLDPSRGPVTDIAWRADGARVAVTDETGTVRSFDSESGRQAARWTAHKTDDGGALGLAWLSDGVVTVGRDGSVRPSNGAGQPRGKATKLDAVTLSVATSADGEWIVAGARDGVVRVIPVEEGAEALELAAYPPPAWLRTVQAAEAAAEARAEAVRRAEADIAAADAAIERSREGEAEARSAVDTATAAAEAAEAGVAASDALRETAAACVTALEAARDAAAEVGSSGGGEDDVLARWEALLATARAEAERAVAAVDAAREAEVAAASAVDAATASLEETTAALAAQDEERATLDAALEEARAALEAARAEAAGLRRAWDAERSASGTWRAPDPGSAGAEG